MNSSTPDLDRALVHVEVAPVQVASGGVAGRAHAEPGHGAGHLLQVPGEVLAAQALLGVLDRRTRRAGAAIASRSSSVDDRRR